MLKGLYEFAISPSTHMSNVFYANDSESARGIRFLLEDFEQLDSLTDAQFRFYISIGNDLYESELVYYNKEGRYVEVIFPPLGIGTYKSELALVSGGRKLLFGVFKIKYVESLLSHSNLDNLKKVNNTDLFEKLTEAETKLDKLLEESSNISNMRDKTYTHVQSIASNVWVINHSLEKNPSVSVVDTGDNKIYGDVSYIDKNNLKVVFSLPFSGKAYLN